MVSHTLEAVCGAARSAARTRAAWPDEARRRDVHAGSRRTYGARRCRAELRQGRQLAVAHKRVARLMRIAGLQGVHRRRWRYHHPGTAVWEDRVQRRFHADRPDRLWFTDITQHRTAEGWVYCAAVLDVYSRRIVGWSIADHLRTELVVDDLQMACWRRRPIGTVVHSDRGAQHTSWLFGSRLRAAGLLGSMGKVACAYDNCVVESFFGSMQIELLDRRTWTTRTELATAIYEYIEAFYNPIRRHSALGYLSPIDCEALHIATKNTASSPHRNRPEKREQVTTHRRSPQHTHHRPRPQLLAQPTQTPRPMADRNQ